MTKEINCILHFEGGILGNQSNIAPDMNGIYVAFSCREHEFDFECMRTLYIGKAEGTDTIKKRIRDHFHNRDEAESGKQSYWEENYCGAGEVVVYSYAICEDNLHDIEAVLIHRNQPLANVQNKDCYHGEAWYTHVKCIGQKGCLADSVGIMRLVRGSK